MAIFRIADLEHQRQLATKSYLEFLRVASMSAGLYVIPAGDGDNQTPHREDEAYFVLSGRGTLRIGSEDHAMVPGVFALVAAGQEHHFHSVTQELSLLVFFAPAQT
jgi:mannose-6-phosphate isomerase-like protein (cupin superfamily)